MSDQRDIFLNELLTKARADKMVMLLSADMGAPSLDTWRKDLPKQVLQTGIAEQSTINFGAGLASRGYKVYVYAMGSWAARCFEQMRYSCAIAKNPITFLANGVALGYVPAGPAHEPTEDIAYMRTLCGIEIHSPTNDNMVKSLVDLTYKYPFFRHIRLERKNDKSLDLLYNNEDMSSLINMGMSTLNKGKQACIVSSGYMLGRALKLKDLLKIKNNLDIGVVDVWRIKPISPSIFQKTFENYSHIITIEEQTLSGGFGSAICEMSCDLNMMHKFLRLGLPERYIFDNGTRDEVLNACGLSIDNMYNQIISFYNK